MSVLPAVDACLNATATVLLLAGFFAIKSGRRQLHERLMLAAFAVSLAFLGCYLWYHFRVVPVQGPVRFNGAGLARTLYFAMLASHVVLAIVNVPLCLVTFAHAWKERWPQHRRWAKITFPVWLYVSVTGVLVYLVLYVWNPAVDA